MYIYTYYDINKRPLYVGVTEGVLRRFREHQDESVWMFRVASISVRGPYDEKIVYEFEKIYISKLKPEYNIKSLYYDDNAELCDYAEINYFDSVTEFIEYYTLKSDAFQRQTYYLRREDIEAIRILTFYMNHEKSALVREALELGLTQIGEQNGHNNIYAEARRLICEKQTD